MALIDFYNFGGGVGDRVSVYPWNSYRPGWP